MGKSHKGRARIFWLVVAVLVFSNRFVDTEFMSLCSGMVRVFSENDWLDRLWQMLLRDENPAVAVHRLWAFVTE